MITEQQWCSSCMRLTAHDVLFEVTRPSPRDDDITNTYKVLSCRGCETVCMSHRWFGTHDDQIYEKLKELSDDELDNDEGPCPTGIFEKVYPAPVTRKKPDWLDLLWLNYDDGKLVDCDRDKLANLLNEIYAAIDGGQQRLAAMGIRALLEQVMIMEIGDIGGFDKKLKALEGAGFISSIQHRQLGTTLEIGHAAMHRAFAPDREALNTCLDIVENVMSAIYSHRKEAKKLNEAVPPRISKLRLLEGGGE